MRIEVDDGVELEVVERGPRDGGPVVLIHGFPLHHGMWSAQLDDLSDGHRLVAYDVRGLGASDPGDGQYTMELFVDDLFGVLDALELDRVVGCGLSMGGYVLLRALERQPDRFGGAVLADTRSAADDDAARLGRAAAIHTLRERGAAAYADTFVEGGALGATSMARRPGVVAAVQEMIRSNDPRGMIGAQLAMTSRTDTTEALEALDVPVLVLVGKEDGLTPPDVARDMAERAPRGRLSVIPAAGHLAPLENPEPFSRALREFLEGRGTG